MIRYFRPPAKVDFAAHLQFASFWGCQKHFLPAVLQRCRRVADAQVQTLKTCAAGGGKIVPRIENPGPFSSEHWKNGGLLRRGRARLRSASFAQRIRLRRRLQRDGTTFANAEMVPEEVLEVLFHPCKYRGKVTSCPSHCPVRLFASNPGLLSDPKLSQVIQGWESLAAPLKDAIIAMIGASVKKGGGQ